MLKLRKIFTYVQKFSLFFFKRSRVNTVSTVKYTIYLGISDIPLNKNNTKLFGYITKNGVIILNNM